MIEVNRSHSRQYRAQLIWSLLVGLGLAALALHEAAGNRAAYRSLAALPEAEPTAIISGNH